MKIATTTLASRQKKIAHETDHSSLLFLHVVNEPSKNTSLFPLRKHRQETAGHDEH